MPSDAARAAAVDDTVAAWHRKERKVRSRCYVQHAEPKFTQAPRQPITEAYLTRLSNSTVRERAYGPGIIVL